MSRQPGSFWQRRSGGGREAYEVDQRILLVGEGNCSFGAALCKALAQRAQEKESALRMEKEKEKEKDKGDERRNQFNSVAAIDCEKEGESKHISHDFKEYRPSASPSPSPSSAKQRDCEAKCPPRAANGERLRERKCSKSDDERKEREEESALPLALPPMPWREEQKEEEKESEGSVESGERRERKLQYERKEASSPATGKRWHLKNAQRRLDSLQYTRSEAFTARPRFFIATTYEDEQLLEKKYHDASGFVERIRENGGIVLHSVDAMQLPATLAAQGLLATPPPHTHTRHQSQHDSASLQFDRIVFNFPHSGVNYSGAGALSAANHFSSNQALLRSFFHSAKPLLPVRHTEHSDSNAAASCKCGACCSCADCVSSAGEIHVTLKICQPYTRWNVIELAEECGLSLVNFYPFEPHIHFPAYHHRPALPLFTHTAMHLHHAATFVFARKVKSDESGERELVCHETAALKDYQAAVSESQLAVPTYRSQLHDLLMKRSLGDCEYSMETYSNNGSYASLFRARLSRPTEQQIEQHFPGFSSRVARDVVSPSLAHGITSKYWCNSKNQAKEICAFKVLERMGVLDESAEPPLTTLPDNIPAALIHAANALKEPKPLCLGLDDDIFSSIESARQEFLGDDSAPAAPKSQHRCHVCDLDLNGPVPLQEHLNSAKHAKKCAQKNINPIAERSASSESEENGAPADFDSNAQEMAPMPMPMQPMPMPLPMDIHSHQFQMMQMMASQQQQSAFASVTPMQPFYAPMNPIYLPMPMQYPMPMPMPMAMPYPVYPVYGVPMMQQWQ